MAANQQLGPFICSNICAVKALKGGKNFFVEVLDGEARRSLERSCVKTKLTSGKEVNLQVKLFIYRSPTPHWLLKSVGCVRHV